MQQRGARRGEHRYARTIDVTYGIRIARERERLSGHGNNPIPRGSAADATSEVGWVNERWRIWLAKTGGRRYVRADFLHVTRCG